MAVDPAKIDEARKEGYSDEEIARELAGKNYDAARQEGYSDDEILSHFGAAPAVKAPASRGPLDVTSPGSVLGASVRKLNQMIPEAVKRPAAAVAGGIMNRLDALTAAAYEGLARPAQQIDTALKAKYAQATGQPAPPPLPEYPPVNPVVQGVEMVKGLVTGRGPRPDMPPGLATDELVRRALGEYHALTPEQADAISRASLGLPTGEIARALTGNEGLALAMQGPAYRAANLVGGQVWKGGRAALGEIPAVAARRAVSGSKTAAIRQGLAEQAEQHLDLKPLQQSMAQIARSTGETVQQVDERIRTARMMAPMDKGAALAALTPEEQAVAKGFDAFDQAQVAKDLAANLQPGVRHAHIERARTQALTKISTAEATGKPADVSLAKRAVLRFEKQTKASGIAAPRTLTRRIDLQGAKDILNRTPEMLTGHAAAVPTPEAQAVLRDIGGQAGAGGAGGPSLNRMGVPQVARISGSRSLTAAEKQGRFEALTAQTRPGVEPPPLYKTMLESTLIRGDQRAARRASAFFLRDISSAPFAQKVTGNVVPEGTVRVSELRTAKSGFMPAEVAELENTVIPRREFNVAKAALENMTSAPSEAKDIIAKAGRWWKQVVLLRTGYTGRNVIDNTISAAQFGAKAQYAIPAAKASLLAHGITKVGKLTIDPKEMIPGLGMTLEQYVASARRTGELSGGFLSSEIPKVSGANRVTRAIGRSLEGWRNVNAVLENSGRALLGMSKRAAGLSEKEVGELVDDALGKYHPAFLSPTERAITTYGFPWYNWLKQITKRSLRLGIERPGSVAAAGQAVTAVNREEGLTPADVAGLGPDVKSSGGIVRNLGKNRVEVFPTSVYGPTDINRMFGTEERGLMALLSNPGLQAYPPVQWLFSAAGLNLFKAKQFTGEDVELPQSVSLMPDAVRAELGVKQVGNRFMGPDRLDYILRQSGPQAIAIGDLSSNDPQAQRRARAFWTGLSSYIRNTKESGRIQRGIARGVKKEERSMKVQSKFNQRRSLEQQRNEEAVRQMVAP